MTAGRDAVWGMPLKPPQKLVWRCLADHADADGNATVGIDLIAWNTGYSPRQVQRIIRQLELLGVVGTTPSHGRGVHQTYTLTTEKGDKLSPIKEEEVTKDMTKRVTEDPTKGVTSPSHTLPVVNVNPPKQDIQTSRMVNSPPTPSRRKTAAKELVFPPPMLAFWDAYDPIGRERSSRQQVLTVWNVLQPDPETFAAIMEGVAAWKESEKWRDGYVPGAHLFLHRHQWQERPAPPKPKPNSIATTAPSRADKMRELSARLRAEGR